MAKRMDLKILVSILFFHYPNLNPIQMSKNSVHSQIPVVSHGFTWI